MIASFTVTHPTLAATLEQTTRTRLVWEKTDTTDNGERLLLLWVESEDFDAFEEAMADDPTVTAPRCLTDISGRRLYQLEQVGEGRAQSVYPALVEAGGVVQELTADADGWHFQVLFPDHDALSHVYHTCEAYDLPFTLHRKYEQSEETAPHEDFGLSEKQRQMLEYAVEQGYYDVPRETDLTTIGEDLDISHQAASERLRRAVDTLVRGTIRQDGVDEGDADAAASRRTRGVGETD